MLSVDADRRPSALDILFGSAWVQTQMSPHELEALNNLSQELSMVEGECSEMF